MRDKIKHLNKNLCAKIPYILIWTLLFTFLHLPLCISMFYLMPFGVKHSANTTACMYLSVIVYTSNVMVHVILFMVMWKTSITCIIFFSLLCQDSCVGYPWFCWSCCVVRNWPRVCRSYSCSALMTKLTK